MSSQAADPFNEPSADIILRSSDDVAFRLHKVILSLASDFFKDMLSLPQPSQLSSPTVSKWNDTAEVSSLPVIEVTESSYVLDRLFRLCYPVDDPLLDSIGDVRTILEAAMKYQMAEAIKIVKCKLLGLAATDPLRVYAVACCHGLEEEASAAAKEVFKQKAQDRYVEELEDISIGAYHRLLSYCERRGRVRDRFRFTFHRAGGCDTPASSTALLEDLPFSLNFADPVPVVTETIIAPHPFDLPDAEVGILASDNIEFRVFKNILLLSSPVLFAKVNTASPSAPLQISVSEPSRILSILLELCYPIPEPRLADLHDISAALAAAEKYEMQRASQVLRASISARKDDPSEDPVLLYATACRFGMRDVAVAAARRTLRTEIMKSSVSELDSVGVSGGCFYRLVDYHRRCKAAVRSILDDRTGDWIEPELLSQMHSCCRKAYSTGLRNPCWYERYLTRVADDSWPKSKSVMKEELLQNVLLTTRDSCSYCAGVQGTFLLIKLSRYVADSIDRLEKEVTLQWLSHCSSP